MTSTDLQEYFEKPCRLKLRGGKEVFGVVWHENSGQNGYNYFFASSDEFDEYKEAQKQQNISLCEQLRIPINIDDVMAVEMLEGLVPGKNMFK